MGEVQVQAKKPRLEWLDVLRCIGMYLVVIGHASKGSTPDTYRFYIYSFHMPLFFLISGAGYYLQTKSRQYDFIGMLKNKARALVWPYFSLNFFAFWIWIYNFKVLADNQTSIPRLIYGILYSNQDHVSAVSNATWFLLTLFLTSMAFFVLQMWSDGNEKYLTLIVLVIGSYGYSMSMRRSGFYAPWHMDTVPIALVLFLMGYLFISHIDFMMELLGGWKRQIIIFVCCFAGAFCCARYNSKISMAGNLYGSFMLFIGAVVGFSICCLLLAMWLPKLRILKFIGRNTIVYLAFHAPMFRFLENYSETTKAWITEHPIWIGTAVFILMIPVVWVFDRYLPFLLGRKKKR